MYSTYTACALIGCERMLLNEGRECDQCCECYCIVHHASPEHECNSLVEKVAQAAVERALARRRAERARRSAPDKWGAFGLGILNAGTFKVLPSTIRGGYHTISSLLFDDVVEWLVRVDTFTSARVPIELMRMVDRSSIKTTEIVRSLGIPAPEIVGHVIADDDGVRQDAIIMKKLPGTEPPQEYDELIEWDGLSQFIREFARVQIKLSDVSFTGIGSLYDDPSDTSQAIVGPLSSINWMSRSEAPWFYGPFRTNRDRYLCHINAVMDLILKGELFYDDLPLVYLAHLEAKSLVEKCEELANIPDATYIRHMDNAPHQFLMQDGIVTGWLDWDWAITTDKAEAFGGPENFYDPEQYTNAGSNAFSPMEILLVEEYRQQGRPDLADCVLNGRKYQRLKDLVGVKKDLFCIGMVLGLQDAFGKKVPQVDSWVTWAIQEHGHRDEWKHFIEAFGDVHGDANNSDSSDNNLTDTDDITVGVTKPIASASSWRIACSQFRLLDITLPHT